MLEIERPQITMTGKLTAFDQTGKIVTIETAKRDENGRPIFVGEDGKVIKPRSLAEAPNLLRTPPGEPIRVQKFELNNIPIFLDPFGNIIDVEQGQADGTVLQAQNGSLIYYATIVNDVYAYFLTGVKDGKIVPGTQFPTTQGELNTITTFASGHGETFVDASALTVEVKTSWVEAASVPNPSDYITTTAIVPTYDQSNPNLWVPNGQKTIQLALVGIHVVGSTNGHPEMIWATFEHLGNTPNGPYSYVNTSGQTISVPQTTAGTWLFAAGSSGGPFNIAHMQEPFGSPNIAAISPNTISPSNTIRWKAWGAASDVSPNPIDGSASQSNSEIISINNSVRGQLVSGDVRGNYIMTGATWTIGGAAPNNNNQVGTSMLSNTTMETYQQGVDNTKANGGSNCFTCHTNNTTGVSHVFPALKPLVLAAAYKRAGDRNAAACCDLSASTERVEHCSCRLG